MTTRETAEQIARDILRVRPDRTDDVLRMLEDGTLERAVLAGRVQTFSEWKQRVPWWRWVLRAAAAVLAAAALSRM